MLEGDHHQRLGASAGALLQIRKMDRLFGVDGNGAQLPVPRLLEAASQTTTIRVIDVDQTHVVEASLAGHAGEDRALGGVREGCAVKVAVVGGRGQLGGGGRGADGRHPGRSGDHLRNG